MVVLPRDGAACRSKHKLALAPPASGLVGASLTDRWMRSVNEGLSQLLSSGGCCWLFCCLSPAFFFFCLNMTVPTPPQCFMAWFHHMCTYPVISTYDGLWLLHPMPSDFLSLRLEALDYGWALFVDSTSLQPSDPVYFRLESPSCTLRMADSFCPGRYLCHALAPLAILIIIDFWSLSCLKIKITHHDH